MSILKADSKLIKYLAKSFVFYFVTLSLGTLNAQPQTNDFHEKEFFDKFYQVTSEDSDRATKNLESLIAGLNSSSISKKTSDEILQRLLVEAGRTAESDLRKAALFWNAAELIALQKNDRKALATSIYYRANTLASLDKYKDALPEYRRAAEVFKDKLSDTDQEKSLLCEIYIAAGETAEYIDETVAAQEFFEKGWLALNDIPEWRKSSAYSKHARALLLGQGKFARAKGDYTLATVKFSEALQFVENDSLRRAEALWELGKLRRETGDLAAGAAEFSEAIKLLDKTPITGTAENEERISLQANLYNSFGLLMLEQRYAKGAEGNLNQALRLARSLNDLQLEGTVLRNLSIASRQTRDFKTAQERALVALKIAESADLTDLEISSNNILAGMAQTAGDHEQAVERLQNSVGLAEKTGNVLRLVESRWRLGESMFAFGRYKEAKNLAREALSTAQKNQWGNLIYLSATLFGRVLVKEENYSAAKEMFELAILEIEQKRLRVVGAEIEKISYMGDKATAYHELLKLLIKASDTKQAIVIAEKLKSRVLEDKAKGRKKIDLTLNSPFSNVTDESAIISYTVTDEACLAFVFLPDSAKPKIHVLPETNKNLTERIKRFRIGLQNFDPTFKTQARELYRLILNDLENEIGMAKNLIIVPDGVLWELPFQALITSDEKYLIEKYTLSYSPSLGTLNQSQRSLVWEKPNRFLGFANSVSASAPPLPEAEKEINTINKYYSKSDVFIRRAATEAKFKTLAPQATQIHLAVHGEINPADSFNSALLLAPNEKEDGRLTVSEILNINLSAKLIVLSACDTSSGQVASGEGLLSLAWAFLASGAETVVAAQWAVEEKATADFVIGFYQAINQNAKSPSEALRTSQLRALKQSAPFNHPFYWSAFVVIGGAH